MPDVWAVVSELDAAMQDRLADVLEIRGADPQQQALRREFLATIPLAAEATVLEVGCGTGVLTRMLAQLPQVSRVTGVDLAPSLLTRAADLAAGMPDVTFQQADARSLPFPDGGFDVVVVDSVLVHVPGADAAVGEALRVLRPGGWLAAFEGDYATTTVALGDLDPLQRCVDAMMSASVNDRWLVRRLPRLLADAGFTLRSLRSHGFVDTAPDGYMVTVVDRGADVLAATGQIGPELAAALKDEARRRGAGGTFFGHIAYASLMAQKPQPAVAEHLAAGEDVRVRAVVSRVSTAAVTVDDVVVGEIGPGLLSLVGVGRHDDETAARALARKIHELRIFPGDDGERSAADLDLPILVVSQFTLYADTRKGRRPSWQDAAVGEVAEPLVEAVVDELRGRGCTVATGVFGARMHVSSVNEGPMTLLLEV